jgi:hypothetical protein
MDTQLEPVESHRSGFAISSGRASLRGIPRFAPRACRTRQPRESDRRVGSLGRISVEVDSGGRTFEWLYDADGAHFARIDRFGNLFLPEREQPK